MKNKICAIHQPNFFPWLGYFDKIKRCDKFVILDHVQFPKTGGGWSNRVAINIHGQSKWITAPISRPSGLWNINETKFQNTNWRDKIIKTLQTNYAKSAYYNDFKDIIFSLITYESHSLLEYNIRAITKLCNILSIDIKDKFVFSSDLDISSNSTQMLIDITKKVGCDTYLVGGGAGGYQEDELFEKNDIELIYQNFKHPQYDQVGSSEFIKGLSIIDYIFNCSGGCKDMWKNN